MYSAEFHSPAQEPRAAGCPRYFFANESRDILAIMGDALDRVGVEWRYNRPNSMSAARRASVARLDEHIGPKTWPGARVGRWPT